jgi:hypothetical protein
MADIPGTPEYQPTFAQKASGEVAKRAPFVLGRALQLFMFGLFKLFQFIIQLVKDAFGR